MTAADDWQGRINRDPDILGGKPVITGTRVPIEIILGNLASGMTPGGSLRGVFAH